VPRISALVLLPLLVLSCGYSTSSLLPEGVHRLAVDVFDNDTFYREIEFTLTREVAAELRQRSDVLLSRRDSADAVLTGRILKVVRPTLVETNRDLVSEQAVIVTAEVTLWDTKTGKARMRFTLANRAEFIVERGETLETAFDEALKDLAEDIVNALQNESFLRERGYEPGIPPPHPPR